MKKAILIIAVLATTLAVKAQSSEKNTPKGKTEYSFGWGLFKSKDYQKGKSIVFVFEKPEFSTSVPESVVESTKYEQKSILWGVIQWTEKKKTTSPVKPQKQ